MNLKKRNKNMKDFFNERIETYDQIHLEKMDNKLAITNNLNNDIAKVLDLGAGTGLELIPLFKKFPAAEVTVIDISEKMLNKLKERNFLNKLNIICGDFFEVEFDEGFDAVISSATLHHFSEEDKFILYTKIYNSLKNGGQFINSDRFVDTQKQQELLMNEYLQEPNKYPHMDTPLTVENETAILTKVGFKNIEVIHLKDEQYKLIKMEK